ncbi:MAG: tRNA (N(6)-L-threonylcarbamoyladenosine(37)-C(2))-methylthiotransferase MtaB [Clostridia bacterium]
MKQKVAFCTLGCKVNQYETNAMIEQFLKQNYEVVDFEEVADIYIINTCTVTNMADRKSRQMLRKVKERNPASIVVACGCYAQVAKEELEKIPQIDMICGVNEKNRIVEYIEKYKENMLQKEYITDVMYQKEFLDFGTTEYTDKTRAVVKVQDGCDRFCSYCIIPYARGHIRSRKIENVVTEIQKIAQEGIKEVVITGIHIASYGKEWKEDISLIHLLEAIEPIEGIERIRLGSLEPTIITKAFLDRLVKLNKICDHFHLSLQSGCDATLKRMNRKYTTETFEKSVELLRAYYPKVALTTDIIVGFPGETQEEFEQTYTFLEKIQFYKMHIFKYSPRKGTKASTMPEQINGSIKEERSRKLIELSDSIQEKQNGEEIGNIVEVLLEEREKDYLKGHTTNYHMIKVKTDLPLENRIVKVKIERKENLELYAVAI